MDRILILVMSSEIPLIQKRRDAVLKTYYNFISQYNNIDLLFYSDGEDLAKHTIKVDATYVYQHKDNEIKHVNMFNVIKEKYYNKYDWFFFVDTDTFVNVPLLNSIISTFDKQYIHGRSLKGCYGSLDFASGGGGYLISNFIISKLFNMKDYKTGYSDVTLGFNARDQKIEIKHDLRFDSSNPWRDNVEQPLETIKKELKNVLTYHYISPEKMDVLYSVIK